MNFSNPTYLFGLLAIAIPIAIHLFDLQKPKKIIFNNISILKSISQKTASVRKIKEWLILLSRILAIIFLILALAQPFIGNKNEVNQSSKIQFFLDNSSSMSVNNIFEKSLKNIENIASSYQKSTNFRLFDLSFSSKDNSYFNFLQLKDKLSEKKIILQNRSSNDIFKNYQNSISSNTNNLFWISDFQKNSYQNIKNIAIDSTSNITLIPMSDSEKSNIYIDSVWTENIFIKQNEKNKLFVTLKNTQNAKTIKLKLIINNVQSGMISETIETKNQKTVAFDFIVNNSKPNICQLLIENDEINFDNKFHFVLSPSQKVTILHITSLFNSFIKQVFINEPSFEIIENKPGLISQADISKANFIIINGYDLLKKNELDLILELTKKGKQLALFPSNSDNNTLILPLLDLGFKGISALTDPNTETNKTHLTFPDVSNPFFKNIFEKTDKQTDMPFVKPVLEIKSNENLLLKTNNDNAFITFIKQNKGKIYLCSTPLNEKYTNLMRHSIFVPLMYKLALNSLKETSPLAFRMDDKWVKLGLNLNNSEKSMTFSNENQTFMVQQKFNEGISSFILPPDLSNAGIYHLTISDTLKIPIALNISKNESDLSYYSTEELNTIFKNNKNIKVFTNTEIENKISEIKKMNFGFPLWKYCLILALLFLFIEIILIRYFK